MFSQSGPFWYYKFSFLGRKPNPYYVPCWGVLTWGALTTLLGCMHLIPCWGVTTTLLGCIHFIPCWGVLPSTETQVPFSHHVSAVACLLQKHWQHWKSCLKYFRNFFLDIGCFLPVGTPPARRGFSARCCRPRWKGYLRWGPVVSLQGEILRPFHIFLFAPFSHYYID